MTSRYSSELGSTRSDSSKETLLLYLKHVAKTVPREITSLAILWVHEIRLVAEFVCLLCEWMHVIDFWVSSMRMKATYLSTPVWKFLCKKPFCICIRSCKAHLKMAGLPISPFGIQPRCSCLPQSTPVPPGCTKVSTPQPG